jgi:CubicO group peptidase (beta-lactamase class C family)
MLAAMSTASWSAHLDAVVDRAIEEQRLVGVVVMIARDGALAYQRAAGLADREAQRKIAATDIFRFTSLTKPLVSAAALALVERGIIALDDLVRHYLAEFVPKSADGRPCAITVRQLLTHTAGLTYAFFQPAGGPYERAGVGDGISDRHLPMAEQLRRIASLPLSYTPGEAWNYSVSMDVLGALLARAAGRDLAQVVREFVTGPLGLTDTGFAVSDPERLVVPYADDKPPRRMTDPDVVAFGGGAGIRYSPARNFDADSYASGGAGMVGTAPEFLQFLETLRRGGTPILKSRTVQDMMSNQIGELRINVETTPSWGFGFGGAVLLDPVLAGVPQSRGTYKWGGVYGHHWYIDPLERLSVVALSNTAIEGMAGPFVAQLMGAIYGA